MRVFNIDDSSKKIADLSDINYKAIQLLESFNDSTLFNELEQKIVGLVNALKAEREKTEKNTGSVIESQKLSKIEEHVTNMINILDKIDR